MPEHNLNFQKHSGLPQVITMLSMYLCIFYLTHSTSVFYNVFFFKTHRYIGYIVSSSTMPEHNLNFKNYSRCPQVITMPSMYLCVFYITHYTSALYNIFLNHLS